MKNILPVSFLRKKNYYFSIVRQKKQPVVSRPPTANDLQNLKLFDSAKIRIFADIKKRPTAIAVRRLMF